MKNLLLIVSVASIIFSACKKNDIVLPQTQFQNNKDLTSLKNSNGSVTNDDLSNPGIDPSIDKILNLSLNEFEYRSSTNEYNYSVNSCKYNENCKLEISLMQSNGSNVIIPFEDVANRITYSYSITNGRLYLKIILHEIQTSKLRNAIKIPANITYKIRIEPMSDDW